MKTGLATFFKVFKSNPIKKIKDPAELNARLAQIAEERNEISFAYRYDGDSMTLKDDAYYNKKSRQLDLRENLIQKQLSKLGVKPTANVVQ